LPFYCQYLFHPIILISGKVATGDASIASFENYDGRKQVEVDSEVGSDNDGSDHIGSTTSPRDSSAYCKGVDNY
jgi:hypothetical protein